MARKSGGGAGLVGIAGLVAIISMCEGGGSGTSTTNPVPGPAVTVAAPGPPPAHETMYVAASALNQRSSPDGSIVSKLSGGNVVTVYESRGTWARVSPDGASPLWVSQSHLCSGVGCYSPPPKQKRNGGSRRPRSNYIDDTCPCSGNYVCIGPRGGRYCITSGGNKRYGV